MSLGIIAGVKLLVAPLNTWLKGRAKLSEIKQEGKIRVIEAKVRGQELRAQREAEAEANYDLEAMRQMQFSWKDEYLLFILSLPFIGSFIPKVQDYVITGWGYISQAPPWYQWSWLGVIAATFGLRWLFSKANPLQPTSKS